MHAASDGMTCTIAPTLLIIRSTTSGRKILFACRAHALGELFDGVGDRIEDARALNAPDVHRYEFVAP